MQESVSLLPYNTLQVNCIAKYFVEIPNTYQLLQFLETEERKTNNHWILWWWSNTLFLNDYYDWIVLHPNIKWIETIKETDNELFLQVGAWEDRNDFVHYTLDNKLCWIENLILIPWNVWTSAVSNIWAYGQEASEVIEEVIGVNLETNTIQKLSNEECNFSYRNSIFKHQLKGSFIITHVVFRLQKLSESYEFKTSYKGVDELNLEVLPLNQRLETIANKIEEIRKMKLPDHTKIWTAWSFFKNPEVSLPERENLEKLYPELKAHLTANETMKLSAGQLIELSWWKGKEINGVKMSEKHALILINANPSWKAVQAYAEQVMSAVKENFWVQLEPEVIYCS